MTDDHEDQFLPVDEPASQSVAERRSYPINPIDPSRESSGYYYDASPVEAGIDLRNYLRILIKHKLLIAAVTGVFFVLGLLQVLLATRLYTATIRLQIDRSVAKIIESGNVMPAEGSDGEFYKTQYELLLSRSLAERVAVLSHYSRDLKSKSSSTDTRAEDASEPSPAEHLQLERQAVGAIMGRREVKPVPGSRLVDISFTDTDPMRAQRVANAFGEGFIAASLDKRFQANASAKLFLEDQLQQLKRRLEEAEKTQLSFAEKERIVVTTDKASIAENNLAAANSALGGIVAERIKNEQQWRQVESAPGFDLPQILTNKGIEELRARRNGLSTELQEKSDMFRSDYPDMVKLRNRLKEIDRQLGFEIKTIKNSLKSAYEASLNQENEMKRRVEELRNETLSLQKRSIQYNQLRREVDTTRALYENLLQRYKEVDVASGAGSNNVFIVDAAELPGGPSAPNKTKSLTLALALGLMCGVGAAFAREHFDDKIYSMVEAEQATGLPILGVIPLVKNPEQLAAQFADRRSAIAEAYRSTCTALQFSTEAGLPKSLLITSAAPSEGKSSTAQGIARQFAATGLKVLLIDADLRRPSLHKTLGLDNGIGLSNYLTRNCEMRDAIRHDESKIVEGSKFYYLTAGPIPPNPVELLNGPRFASLLTACGQAFDLIVIDGPPVAGMADTLVLSNIASATLFVVAGGQARISGVRTALKRLAQARSRPVGVILTKFDARTASYGYGGYGYGYGYEYDYGKDAGDEHGADKKSPIQSGDPPRETLQKLSDDAAAG
ncbi:polysaccharide biosynthesis tyrosine autokinase [Methylocystis sp. FS]|uniref:GumC family protein n=1 Tax=Methylocystis silviterrae TaxID=2743612 RepID=UPI001581AAB8|nr:polysaccharide biosynthesis tyrosine autokinase [Methylocystis silviterrae]NUJ81726.1 polysaccharide biosynthesis tyrosine autokinase [Methylocystis silviterrae]